MEWPKTTCNSLQSLHNNDDEKSIKQKESVDYNNHDKCHKNNDICSEITPVTMNNQNNVLNMEIFDEKFRLLNIFKPSPDRSECTSIKISGINKAFTRSSTLIFEDEDEDKDECQKNNCNNSLNMSDDPDPSTSTPEREKQSDRYKILRPPKLTINESIDEDIDIIDTVECSPVKSPFPSDSINNSSLGLDDTLLASSFDSPPSNASLSTREKKLMNLLGRFGLSHFAMLFIEQEVDVDLFLTLTNNDLKEIGIQRKTDRNIILSVIEECNKRLY